MRHGKHVKCGAGRRPLRSVAFTGLAGLVMVTAGQIPATTAGADDPMPMWTATVEEVYMRAADGDLTLLDFAQAVVLAPNSSQQEMIDDLKESLSDRGLAASTVVLYHLLTDEGPTDIAVSNPSHFIVRPDPAATEETVYNIIPLAAAVPTMPTTTTPGLNGGSTIGAMPGGNGPTSDLVRTGNSVYDRDERAEARWKQSTADCYMVQTDAYSRIVCWQADWQSGSSNPERDHWQFALGASGYSRGSREMEKMWVEAKPWSRSPYQQFDQIPVPGTALQITERCDKVVDQLKLESGEAIKAGFSRNWERVTCEEYFPKVYEDEAHWATVWDGDNLDDGQMRQVKFIMGTKTYANDCCPVWQLLTGQSTSR